MEIIKKGEVGNPTITSSCFKCGTIFAYTESDIQSDRDGRYVVCPLPECGSFIAAESPRLKAMETKFKDALNPSNQK
jgi:DNA-directed RNA polymerase subunit RPC12/RpoP